MAMLAYSSGAQVTITNGLISYYPFNGNANDIVGAKNGTVQNASLTADRFNNPGLAYAFNGSNAAVNVPPATFNNLAQGTITTWVELDRNTREPISCKQHDGVDAYAILTVGFYRDGNGASVSGVPGKVYFRNSRFQNQAASSQLLSTGTWYQVAATFTSTNCILYINGVPAGSAVGGFSIPNDLTPTATSIGSWEEDLATQQYAGLAGKIDDFRLYNRALSSTEVAQLYASESAVCTPHKATATAQVVNGFVVGAFITDGGCGYTNAPLVLVQDGGGSGATATAIISNGSVIGINIINPGSGYSTNPPPRIVVASPPFVPTVSISFSRVNVLQHVVLGRSYVLESSPDLVTWTATGPQFTAASELVTTEFIINQTGLYFRLREMP